MIKLSLGIFADLENDRVEPGAHPTDGAVLRWQVQTLIQIIRAKENFLRFLKSDAALRIPPKTTALPRVEMEAHASITVIPQNGRGERSAGWKPALQIGAGAAAVGERGRRVA